MMESPGGKGDAPTQPAPDAQRGWALRARSAHAALVVALAVTLAGFAGLDRTFYERVSQRLNTESSALDRDFYARTRPFWLLCRYAFAHALGGAVIYFSIVGLHPRGFRPANCGLIAVVTAALLANLSQAEIGRPRPNRSRPGHGLLAGRHLRALPDKTSFPSGEAATAFAIAAVLRRIWPRGCYIAYSAAALASIARLVNGAHYLSDVVAGAALGFLVADAVYRYADRHYERLRAVCQVFWPRRHSPSGGCCGRSSQPLGRSKGPTDSFR